MLLAFAVPVALGAEELTNPMRALLPEVLHYRIESSFIVDHELVGVDRTRVETDLVPVSSELEVRCRQKPVALGRWELDCTITSASVVSGSASPEVARLALLASGSLPGAGVTVAFHRNGRLRSVDLDADAAAQPHGDLSRLVVERSVAGLDLAIPALSVDSWRESRTSLVPATGAAGPLWRVQLDHEVVDRTPQSVRVQTVGTLYWLEVELDLEPSRRIVGHIDGTAVIDSLGGALVQRDWVTRLPGGGFFQLGSVERIGSDVQVADRESD